MADDDRDRGGRLADNIVHFGRALRRAGLPVGPAVVVDAIRAVETAGVGSREDFYWTLHAVFVKRREHRPVFHEAFHLYWQKRDLLQELLHMFSPKLTRPAEKPPPGASRASAALAPDIERLAKERDEIEVDMHLTASTTEALHTKDFAQMSADELAAAKRALERLALPDDRLKTRRLKASLAGRIDPRRTMRTTLRAGGALILPEFRSRATIEPPIVALCDISGSMSEYSRLMLHFMHALTERRRRVHTFVFGTRLTNVTRQLKLRDADEALAGCSDVVADWSGGTRIAAALHEFNRRWSRRVLVQGATMLLITDGLERDSEQDLSHEIDRLHRSCRRLIWLNPLLRYDGFAARAQGIRTMLPHVDAFRPVHTVAAVADLVAALSGEAVSGSDPRTYLKAA